MSPETIHSLTIGSKEVGIYTTEQLWAEDEWFDQDPDFHHHLLHLWLSSQNAQYLETGADSSVYFLDDSVVKVYDVAGSDEEQLLAYIVLHQKLSREKKSLTFFQTSNPDIPKGLINDWQIPVKVNPYTSLDHVSLDPNPNPNSSPSRTYLAKTKIVSGLPLWTVFRLQPTVQSELLNKHLKNHFFLEPPTLYSSDLTRELNNRFGNQNSISHEDYFSVITLIHQAFRMTGTFWGLDSSEAFSAPMKKLSSQLNRRFKTSGIQIHGVHRNVLIPQIVFENVHELILENPNIDSLLPKSRTLPDLKNEIETLDLSVARKTARQILNNLELVVVDLCPKIYNLGYNI